MTMVSLSTPPLYTIPSTSIRHILNPPSSLLLHHPSPIYLCIIQSALMLLSPAANQMAQQMSQMNPSAAGAGLFQPGADADKMFLSEAENLEVLEHWCILDGVENRLLASI